MGSWIGISLVEVGGASACTGLEAEGQEYFALCLSPSLLRINLVILKLAPWKNDLRDGRCVIPGVKDSGRIGWL